MNIKSGTYKVRILQIDNWFYPQIYIKSFWHTGWCFIDMESLNDFTGTLGKPLYKKTWNESIEEAEQVISRLKDRFSTLATKIHNEREEQF